MSKIFYITICATIVKSNDGADILEPEQVMTVRGKKVHYVKPHGDMLFCQILNNLDEVLFSAPANSIKHVWSPTYPDDRGPISTDDMAQVIQFKEPLNVV